MKARKLKDGNRGTQNRAARRRSMRMRGGVAAIAAASAIGLGAGLVAPPAPAQADSTSILGGTAIDPEGLVTNLFGSTAWNLVKGYVGDTNSIAVLPGSLAATFAGTGESATAFSMIGLALATTDTSLLAIPGVFPGFAIPGQLVCLGALTFGYSSTDGACVNALGVLGADYNPNDRSISGALVNPLGALSIIDDPVGALLSLLTDVTNGDSRAIQKFLTDDFVRLGFSWGGRTGAYGLPSIVSLTSDYGLKNPITVKWLGQEVTIFPKIASSEDNVATPSTSNYFGFPVLTTGAFDASQIIPGISGLGFNNIRFPGDNLAALASLIGDIIGGNNPLENLPFSTSTTTSTLAAASSVPTTFSALQQTVGTTGTTPSTFAARSASANTTPQKTTGTTGTTGATGVAGVVPNAVQKFQSGAKNAWQSGANAAQQTQQNWAERQQQRTEQWRSGWQQNGGTNQWSTQGGQSANQTPAAPGAGRGWRPSVPSAPSAPSFSGFGANGGNQSNQSSSSTSNN
ncbi:hypothetical protein [Gordonia crocea]|uniref:PE-PPE domain-containing protein n=1 Tax=Gordonia crocea TaxID=589162 RepID=A0A7I9UZS7_9ACTN|nr:hypothetical protein [Gordonia crocea]GED98684.1 hypothetical protein nbrc107697_27230 [Gordonia crocea]